MAKKIYTIIYCTLLLAVFSCSNKFDGKDGIKTVYFPNSTIVHQVVEYKNGKRIGELKEYYRNGNLKVRQNYKNDTLNDSAFFYHENGNIKEIQYLKNFKKEGAWKKFNKDGQLYEEINFKNDYLEGCSSKYSYRTRKRLQRLNYESGMKEGKQNFYYNNGKPKAILYYHYNNPCLGTEEWTENGEVVNNDFEIVVREQNKLLLENKLLYFIKIENPQPNDEVYLLSNNDSKNYATTVYPLTKIKNGYLLEYNLAIGGFVMETARIGVFRKTSMGNTYIKTKSITVSANNF